MVALGPGVLKIGDAGAESDYSCLVNSLTLSTDVSVAESSFKLCGTEVPGVLTSTGTLDGNLDQDIDQTGGLFEFMSKNSGAVKSFRFEPSTSAGLEARGSVLIVPMSFGGDTYGNPMVSDISLATVGDIEYHRAGTLSWTQDMAPRQASVGTPATGATAGTPGTWTPAGSSAPASVAALQAASPAITASPATAWTVGQYVQTKTAGAPGQAHWSGTAWVAGPA